MDEQMQQQHEEQPARRKWTAQDRKIFVLTLASTVGAGEALSLIAHAGWGGAAFAAAAATIIAKSSPDLYQGIKDYLPWTEAQNSIAEIINHREPGSRSLVDRLMGRHDSEDAEPESDADEGTPEADDIASPISGVIPQAPKFPEMCHLVTPHRLVLCWTVDGPVFGTIEDLLSMAIIGKPGRGKTTALIYYVAMLLQADAEVHVWDPHGSMSELDGAFANLHYTDDLADIPGSMERLRAELESRRLLYKRTKQVKHPLLLLVDELPVIGEYSKSAFKGEDAENSPVKLISDFVLQARKWNCYFIGAGQSTDAEILPTRVTENLSSRIVFYSSTRRATMAGIDLETAKKFLPLLKDDNIKGKMIFDCSRFSEPILGAIPYATISDVQQFLGVQQSAQLVSPTIETPEDDIEEKGGRRAQNMTLDTIMQLYTENKIDFAMFQRLLNMIPDNQEKASRSVPSPETEGREISSQSANLRLVPSQRGTIPVETEALKNEPVERIPAISELPPLLGKDDYQFSEEQAQDFLRRFKKTPNIHACLSQMVNSKGEIGISKRYYKHAAWLANQQQQQSIR